MATVRQLLHLLQVYCHSRVLEINPVTLAVNWSVDPRDFGFSIPMNGYKFYSPYGGNLQRLPNGNTLITLATEGLVIEVTPSKEIVWQWTCPYRTTTENLLKNNMIYRVYRYPTSNFLGQEILSQLRLQM